MAALLPRQRLFVEHLFIGDQGPGRLSRAYRAAGYASENADAVAASASRLAADPGIQLAISEMARKTAVSIAPEALAILKQIMRDPQNKDQFKAAKMFQEAAAPPEQKIDVSHTHEIVDHRKDTLAHLRHLIKLGTPREGLEQEFGLNGLPRYLEMLRIEDASKVEDAEFVEVPNDDRGW
jgi:phage terminase small subunit